MVKIKIEEKFSTGEKVSIIIEGSRIDRGKLNALLSMIEAFSSNSIMKEFSSQGRRISRNGKDLGFSLLDVIIDAIECYFGDGRWFTTRELYEVLKSRYGIDVKTSTLSTYLLRLSDRGVLERGGSKALRVYRLSCASSSM